jgi:hypothetical protein
MDEDLKDRLRTRLTVPLWPDAGTALNLRRNATYDAAARGEIPCIEVGRRKKSVPTSWLRRLLGIEEIA